MAGKFFTDFHMFPQRPFDPKAAQFLLKFNIYINIKAGKNPGRVFF
jgi:hypothetical protein